MKKGDRVEWVQNGETRYGIVFRGGKNPIVYLDGGATSVSGPARAFAFSKHPLPKDEPSVMDKWDVKSYKNTGLGEETPQFNADITVNGKVVLHVSNDGRGGCNRYYPARGMCRGVIDQLITDARVWGEQFGYPYDFEVEDTWVEWATREKIYGKKAVDYFKEYAGVTS